LDAEDKFRDMPPPEPDRKHMTGNYVLLNCGKYEVFLGHLQERAVRVRPGDFIETGAVLGQVGNSGNTGEPHLHIHAQRPSGNAGMLAGDPLPVRFNGRFLSRNSWMRQHAGPFAPPVGGIVIFLAASVIGLVYWFPIRRRFRTWGATDEETRQR